MALEYRNVLVPIVHRRESEEAVDLANRGHGGTLELAEHCTYELSFADKKSGKNAEREELRKALDYLREGDTLLVVGSNSTDSLTRILQLAKQIAMNGSVPTRP